MNTTGELMEKTGSGAPSWPMEPGNQLTQHDVWQLVAEAVMENDWVSGCLPADSMANGLPSLTMLQLITYFYTMGILGSQAIEEEVVRDPLARAVCAGLNVDGWQVHCFRRANIELLKHLLARVFRRMRRRELVNQGMRLNAWQLAWQSEQTANDCLSQAIFLDSMALDE